MPYLFLQSLARAIRGVRTAFRHIAVSLLLLASSLAAQAANYTDIWWNAAESGWGVTLTHHNDKIFGVWYLYDASGLPYWVIMPDGAISSDGRTFAGDLFETRGPAFDAATFRSDQVSTTRIGTARVDFDADGVNATTAYTINGTTYSKRISRYPFGSAPPNPGTDMSDLWWNPNESGWGLSLSHHGDSLFAVWYTYGPDNRPLWIVMPGGTQSGNRFTGKLYTTSGSPFNQSFDPRNTVNREVGTGTIEFDGANVTFSAVILGRTHTKRCSRFGFGTPTGNKSPQVALSITSTANPIVAPATLTLSATASDSDGTVAKVMFYKGSEKLAEAMAAPYSTTVSGLAAGSYTFSAIAVDNKGATSTATGTKVVTAPGGTGGTTNKPPKVALTAPVSTIVYPQGAPIALAVTASDPDGTVAKVEYFADTTKVGEATASPWSANWANPAQGVYSLTAVATDDKGAATTSAAVAVTVTGPAPALDAQTKDAARFLTQATFGIKSVDEIAALQAQGYEAWLNAQFAMSAASHVKYVDDRKAAGEKADEERAYEAIWQQWLTEPGQLRARMAFALSEIFVISNIAPDLNTYAMASYMDLLNRNAFGNYRTLLEEVTLHPAMGYYLNMIGSKKEDPAKGTHPNENYAREVMQLFSIGLAKLNPDGTRVLDGAGQPVPTYDQSVVQGLAAAFTGWNFNGNDTTKPSVFDPAKPDWLNPMVPWEMWHDLSAKKLFDGITLPAGQGARKDMSDALNALFNHQNVGPFFGRLLIQRFVTSNPSPAYIGRVAAAFANNGQGVRGDLRATLRAVLLDPEARSLAKTTEPGWGKQREPVIRFANFLRGFNATSTSGRNHIWYLDSADEGLNQSPLLSPSVFNFFSPNYRQPGALSAAGLVAPEFQVTTETSMVGGLNFFANLVKNGSYGSGDTKLTLNFTELNAMANNPAALADRLNLLLFAGGMSEATRTTIITTLNAMAAAKTGTSTVTDRVKAALILVALSPEYVIQK